jgi:hypothetical protein
MISRSLVSWSLSFPFLHLLSLHRMIPDEELAESVVKKRRSQRNWPTSYHQPKSPKTSEIAQIQVSTVFMESCII